MPETQNPTLGQKIVMSFLAFILLSSFVNFVNIKSADQNINSIPVLTTSQSSNPNPILEQKSESKKELKVENLSFNDELGVFVNDQNKSDLIQKTKLYIAKYSKSKPVLDAEMVVNFAQKTQFPLDLMLIQAQTESNFCTNGRAVISKQCWNIGAYDAGDNKKTDCNDGNTICQDSYFEGLQLYHKFMTDCHFHAGEKASLQKFIDRNFSIIRRGSKICGPIGARYATDKNYRQNITNILYNNFNPIFAN